MIWTDYTNVYEATMSNAYMPFFIKDNKLYLITSWSMGTTMLKNYINNGYSYKAEGIEILSYGN